MYKMKSIKFLGGKDPEKYRLFSSSQDGDIGRHGSPLHTTTSKLQLKYRTIITQECQKLS